MKPGFTVGETARICSIPADTLRYYDKIGLIHPSVMFIWELFFSAL